MLQKKESHEHPETLLRITFASVNEYAVSTNNGRVYIPRCIAAKDDNRSLSASCGKGKVKARLPRVHELKSAWE